MIRYSPQQRTKRRIFRHLEHLPPIIAPRSIQYRQPGTYYLPHARNGLPFKGVRRPGIGLRRRQAMACERITRDVLQPAISGHFAGLIVTREVVEVHDVSGRINIERPSHENRITLRQAGVSCAAVKFPHGVIVHRPQRSVHPHHVVMPALGKWLSILSPGSPPPAASGPGTTTPACLQEHHPARRRVLHRPQQVFVGGQKQGRRPMVRVGKAPLRLRFNRHIDLDSERSSEVHPLPEGQPWKLHYGYSGP